MVFGKKEWSKKEILSEVEKIIKSIMKSYEKKELGDQAEAFFEQIDSLRIIELVVLTEKKFKISFESDQLSALNDKKLDTFVDLIADNLAEAKHV